MERNSCWITCSLACRAGVGVRTLLAETTLGKLSEVIKSDLFLKKNSTNHDRLLDRALLWLHEQEVIRLNKGLGGIPSSHDDPASRRETRLRQRRLCSRLSSTTRGRYCKST